MELVCVLVFVHQVPLLGFKLGFTGFSENTPKILSLSTVIILLLSWKSLVKPFLLQLESFLLIVRLFK